MCEFKCKTPYVQCVLRGNKNFKENKKERELSMEQTNSRTVGGKNMHFIDEIYVTLRVL